MKLTTLLLISLFGMPFAGVASAQSNPGMFELTPYGGYRFGGTFDDAENGTSVDLDNNSSFGLIFNVRQAANTQWEVIYSRQSTQADTSELGIPEQSLDVDVHYLQGGGTYQGGSDKVRPYLAATIGGTYIEPGLSSYESDVFWSFSIGGGLNFMPTKRLGVRLEARAFATLLSSDTDLFCVSGVAGAGCAISVDGKMMWQLETFAGVVFRF
jgi:hypothetical protein